MLKILVIFGTRPEAIKMAPVILALQRETDIETIVCVTGQHRGMLDDALRIFNIHPNYDFNVMKPDQSLASTTSAVLEKLTPLLKEIRPDRVLVHGDTTTTLAASIACFYCGIPVGHVEAGLRTNNIYAPWPEEFNRRATDMIADLLWAPTTIAANALKNEGIQTSNIRTAGNTVIDALRLVRAKINDDEHLHETIWHNLPQMDVGSRMILVTGHRRENFDTGLANMCNALNRLSERTGVEIVWPLHPNPNVRKIVRKELRHLKNVHIIEPQNYISFVALMMRSTLIITDSGGIQEEAPALGKPVLITREETERPEVVAVGAAKLVGTNATRIFTAACEILDNPEIYQKMSEAINPYGDGYASELIVADIRLKHQISIKVTNMVAS